MYARVATFQGDPAGLDETIAGIKSMVESGEAPPGLEDSKFMMLVDKASGQTMGVSLFDTEDARQRGHDALEAMTPGDGMARSAVQFYEVAISTV